ncbi:hypothetical protein [Opitutus terrae]|uniref:Uncharacterized protein n=1 Tax=Opitutus terrae (strain DSM 11246 / JCM 15787 / PB90-1) TaxID=452637 RepID=B1ZPG7_OPITP|nr:hypothetical protein [Opitutus terrae]ACB74486.1 hypothetical protein Oter_1200 [Opitutus terrae PB90-1]
MKTHHEIQVEAQQIDAVTRRQLDEWRQRNADALLSAESLSRPATRVLFSFPLSRRTNHRSNGGVTEPHTQLTWRWIEGGFGRDQPEYYLVEEWAETTPTRGIVDQVDAFVDSTSDSVEELLFEGYKQVEEDALAERLTPVINRLEEDPSADAALAAIADIESIFDAPNLSPAERIRTKAEIRAFLAGRMDAIDFIDAVIERQYHREPARETMAEHRGQRLLIGES